MLQTIRVEKVDEKNWVVCLVSMFPSWVMVCKLSRSSHYTLSENAMVYRGQSHRSLKISD